MAKRLKMCPEWKSGVCMAIAREQDAVTFCPAERAENCKTGQCCHHPLFKVMPILAEMKQAGVNLKRYGSRLRDPDFVVRLHAAFLKARAKKKRVKRRC